MGIASKNVLINLLGPLIGELYFSMHRLQIYSIFIQIIELSKFPWAPLGFGLGNLWVIKRSNDFIEEIWVSDLECRELIASNWIIDKAKVGVEDVDVRLRNCALETDRWGFKKFGSIKKNIVEI